MNTDEILQLLVDEADTKTIQNILDNIDERNDAEKIENINYLQNLNNKLYENRGFDDITLELQLIINKLRYKYDVADPSEFLHEEYVQ